MYVVPSLSVVTLPAAIHGRSWSEKAEIIIRLLALVAQRKLFLLTTATWQWAHRLWISLLPYTIINNFSMLTCFSAIFRAYSCQRGSITVGLSPTLAQSSLLLLRVHQAGKRFRRSTRIPASSTRGQSRFGLTWAKATLESTISSDRIPHPSFTIKLIEFQSRLLNFQDS